MSGDKGRRLLHAEYVLSAFSLPAMEIQLALTGWLLHHQKKGAVDDSWVWSLRSFRDFPSFPFLLSSTHPSSQNVGRIFEMQWHAMFVLIKLSNDFPYCKVNWPRLLPFSIGLVLSVTVQLKWRAKVAGFRLAFYSRVSSEAFYTGEWVTGHSAQWILSWCGY